MPSANVVEAATINDLVICYQPDKSMEIADALSRLSPEEKNAIPGMIVQVHNAKSTHNSVTSYCREHRQPRLWD